MIELRHDALSVTACIEAVRSSGCGGLAVFVGSVRDISEGKPVQFLEYEAYEPMALVKLQQVVDEARSKWPVKSIAIQHRLGHLAIGDDAVVVAVAAPHRGEAFRACEYVIDRLKQIVPIWKKEHGEDGATWIGGPTADLSASDEIPGTRLPHPSARS